MMVTQKPDWLKIKYTPTQQNEHVAELLKTLGLHTVCESADCPNWIECFGRGTSTFMILGDICTRNCRFCVVGKGKAQAPDPDEPQRIAQAVVAMKLKHVVITTVTRDDLPDGGASQFATVIREVRVASPTTTIEVLISDLKGDRKALKTIVDAQPDILGHNLETVPRLYPEVRPMADYKRSLEVLEWGKRLSPKILTKSGIMVGLGEKHEESTALFEDLRKISCDILTVGQYLAPSAKHHEVVEYVHPDEFLQYKDEAYALGFRFVASGPLVRSSYHAEEALWGTDTVHSNE